MLVGDRAVIRTGPLNKNINYAKCEIQGNAVAKLGRTGTLALGYIFEFKAVKSGKATILEKISRVGKRKGIIEIKRFRVRVYSPKEIPEVSLSSIKKHPDSYRGKLILLSGMSCGWGNPKKAAEVWGSLLTRSDWAIEDGTGAGYVSGIPKVEKGKHVEIICEVAVLSGGHWALIGHKVVKEDDNTGT